LNQLLSPTFVGLVVLLLLASACDWLPQRPSQSSVTVRLPPPRTPAPGFKTVADTGMRFD
jgi:hypothetical protein